MARPKASNRDTRYELLKAAMLAIESGGEHSIRTKAIAEQVGVTEPSLFHFFGNREGLIIAAHAERYRETHLEFFVPYREAVHACRSKQDFIDLCIATMERVFRAERSQARLIRIQAVAGAFSRPELASSIQQTQREVLAVFIDALNFAQSSKWISRTLDIEAYAYWFVGHITGRIFAELDGNPDLLVRMNPFMERIALEALGISRPAK